LGKTATAEEYKESVETFNEMIESGPKEGRGKPYLSREGWMAATPNGGAVEKWVLNIWNCFDTNNDDQLSVCTPKNDSDRMIVW